MIEIKRGDVFYADLGDGVGSEQQGIRPVVVIQNDIGNKFSPTVIVAAITSKRFNKNLPTHVTLSQEQYNLHMPSTILAEQVRTIDKKRLKGAKEYSLNELDIIRLDRALDVSFERLKSRMSGVASFAV